MGHENGGEWSLHSVELPRQGVPRTVRIFLPRTYDESGERLPVLYMFDGHNLFDTGTATYHKRWKVEEAVAGLVSSGTSRGAVVVGLDAPHEEDARYSEYTVWDWARGPDRQIAAQGAATVNFLCDVVVPYIEAHYNVRSERAGRLLAGSSMGGYMTLHTATSRSELFATALAFSPVALDAPMKGHLLRQSIHEHGANEPVRFYLDMGSAERLAYAPDPQALVQNMHDLAASLRAAGHQQVTTRVVTDAIHDEDAWAARFPEVLAWALSDENLARSDVWTSSEQ